MTNEKLPICPRCESNTTSVLTTSPVKDVWVVYHCGTCFFAWRSTEGGYITDPKKYDKSFKFTPEDMNDFEITPAIPELEIK